MSQSGSVAAVAAEVPGADARLQESDSGLTFLRAARAGNLDKIEDILGTVDVNYQNPNGLCALHLASREGHLAVVLKLIERGANVNLATKKGNAPLHVAALAGRFDVVRAVVECGANLNAETEAGFTAVYMAAQENHEDIVRYLLEHGADLQKASKEGYTPMAVAVREGSDRAVCALLEFGQAGRVKLPALHVAAKKDDVDAAAVLLRTQSAVTESPGGFTPLHIAAHYGKLRVAKLLLDHDADVNFKAKNAITPLHVSARWGQCEIIALLASHGADLAARTADGLTPVHCAARNGHQLAVDCLLELCGGRAGSAVLMTSAKTKSGLTALHMTAQGDHSDCARLLIHHGASVDDVSKDRLTALHIAAHYGHYATAKLLLDRRCDPDARAVNGFTPLHIACKKHRVKVVQLLLKYGASIDAVTVSGLSPLHIASFVGAVDVIQTLLRHHGAETMQMETLRGETPLHLAAKADQPGTLTMLLRNGADVNAKVKDQQTALHIAARQGSDELAQALLQHGAQPNATTTDGCTPLHIAAKEGHRLVAARLLDHGARADLPTEKGMTPLHIAAKYGQPAVARLLLEHGADINSSGKNGLSPLHVATHYGSSEVEILLLDSGASPHVTAKNGYTPLHIAARTGRALSAAALLDHGAKPSAASKSGFYPVHMAAREGHTEMIRLLFERGASVNSPSGNGIRPLHLCAQEDKVEVAGTLLRYGANVNPRTTAGYTPLHTACHFGHVEMARFLIANGAKIDEQTSLGYTPLHQAAQQGHILVVEMLLQQGASPMLKTNAGLTALDIARRLGNVSVSQVLKRATGASCSSVGETDKDYNMESPEKMDDGAFDESDDENEGAESLSPDPYSYLACDNLFESSAYGSSTQGDSIVLSASFLGINGSFHFDEKIRSSDNNVSSLGPWQQATKAYYKEDLSELASPLSEHAPLVDVPVAHFASEDDAAALSRGVDVKALPIGSRSEEDEADGATRPSVECADSAAASSHRTVESRVAVEDHIEPSPPVAVFCAEVGTGKREEMTCRRGKTSAAGQLCPGDEAALAVDGQPAPGRLLVLDPWGRPIRRRADEDSGGGLLTVPIGTWLATAVDPKGKVANSAGQPVVDATGKAVVLHDPAAVEVLATPNMTALLDAQGRPVLVPRGSVLSACGSHGCLRSRLDARPVTDAASGRPVVVPLACRLLPLDDDGLDGAAAADAIVSPTAAAAAAAAVTAAEASNTAKCVREAADRVKTAQQRERPLMVMLPNGSLARCDGGTYIRFGFGSRIVQPLKDGRLRDSSGRKLVDASGKSLKLGKKSLHVAEEDVAVVVTNRNEIARDRFGEGWLLLPCGSTVVRVDEKTGHIVHEDGTPALGPGGTHVDFQPDRLALVLDESGMPLVDGSGGPLVVPLDSDIVEPGRTEHVLRPDGQPVYDHEGAPLRLDTGSALLPAHGDGTVRLQPFRGGGGRVRSADGKLVKVAPGRALAVGPDDKPYVDWLGSPLTVPLGSVLVPEGKPHVLLRSGHVVADPRGRAVCFESPVELVAPAKLTDVIAARAGPRVAAYVQRSLSLLSASGQDAAQAIAVDVSSGLPHLDVAGRPVDAKLTDQLAIYGRTGLMPVEPVNTRVLVGGASSSNNAKLRSQTDDKAAVSITATHHETSGESSASVARSTKRLDSSEEVLCQVSLPTLTMLSASDGSLATNLRSMSNDMDAPDVVKIGHERDWQSIAALDSISQPAASAAQSPSSDSFLVSFMVDARGGIMRGYRREGMRFIIPPRCVDCPTRINCRLVRQSKLASYGLLPPKMSSLDGQQLASRVLQLSPAEHKFLSPVLLEIPHCAALRGGEREIYAMRSADGQHWSEHWQLDDTSEQAARERRLSRTIYGIEPVEQLSAKKVVRLLLPDLPHSLTLVTRLRSDAKTIGSEGGIIESSVVPQVRVTVPAGAVNRDTLVSLKVLPVSRSVVSRYAPASTIGLGSVVTVGPFLRRFRQPLTITIPLPLPARRASTCADPEGDTMHAAHSESQEKQSLHVLCNASDNEDAIFFDDVTSSTPVKIENGCATFTSTLSARFLIVSCLPDTAQELESIATDVYRRLSPAPFLAHFVIFARRQDQGAVSLRVLCVTDDRLGNEVLETQESYQEVARSLDVEVLDGMTVYAGLVGNLRLSSRGNQEPSFRFSPFHENRLSLHAELQEALTSSTVISAGRLHANGPAEDGCRDGAAPDGAIIFLSEASGLAQEQQTLCCLSLKVPALVSAFGSRSSLHKRYEIGDARDRSGDFNKGTGYAIDETIVPLYIERMPLPTTRQLSDRGTSKWNACEWLGRELSALLSRSSQPADRYDAAGNALPPDSVEPFSDVTSVAERSVPRQLEVMQEETIVPYVKPRAAAAFSLAVVDLPVATEEPFVEKEKHDGRQQPADPQLISGERLSGGAPARRNLAAAVAAAAHQSDDAAVASPDGGSGNSQRPAEEPNGDQPADEKEDEGAVAGVNALEEEILVPQNANTSAAAAPAVNEGSAVEPQDFRNVEGQVTVGQDSTCEGEAYNHQLTEAVPGVDNLSLVVSRQAEHYSLADAPGSTWNDNSGGADVSASGVVAVDSVPYMREAPIRLGSEYRSSVKRVVRETHFGCDDKIVEQYSAGVCDQGWLTTNLPPPATMEAGCVTLIPDSVSPMSPSCRVHQGRVYLSGPPSEADVNCRESAGVSLSRAGEDTPAAHDGHLCTVLCTGCESGSLDDESAPMQCWNKIVELDEEPPGNSELLAAAFSDGGSLLAVGDVSVFGGSVSSRITLQKRRAVCAEPTSPDHSDIDQEPVGSACRDAFSESDAAALDSEVDVPCATSSSTKVPSEPAVISGPTSLQPFVKAGLVEENNQETFAMPSHASPVSIANGDSLMPVAHATSTSKELEVKVDPSEAGGLAAGSVALLRGETYESSEIFSQPAELPSESELLSKPMIGESGASLETEPLLVQEKTAVCEVCPGIEPDLLSPGILPLVGVSSMQRLRRRDPTAVKNPGQPHSGSLLQAVESSLTSGDESCEDMPPAEAVATTTANMEASFQAAPAEQPEVLSVLTIALDSELANSDCLPENEVPSIATIRTAKETESASCKPCDGPVVTVGDSVLDRQLIDTAIVEAAIAPPVIREVEELTPDANEENLADSKEAEQHSFVHETVVEQLQGKVFPSTDTKMADSRIEKVVVTTPQILSEADAPSHGDSMFLASSREAATTAATATSSMSEEIVKAHALELKALEEASLKMENKGIDEPEQSDESLLLPADSKRPEEIVAANASELEAREEASSEAKNQGVCDLEWSEKSLVLSADRGQPEGIAKAHALELEATEEASSEVTEQDASEPEQRQELPVPPFDSERLEQIVKAHAEELKTMEEASSEVRSPYAKEPERCAESPRLPADRGLPEEIVTVHALELQSAEEASPEVRNRGISEPERNAESPMLPSDSEHPEEMVTAHASELETSHEALSEVRNQGVSELEHRSLSPVLPADSERPEDIVQAHASELEATEEATPEVISQGVNEPEQSKESPLLHTEGEHTEKTVKARALEFETTEEASSEVIEQDPSEPERNEESPVPSFDSEQPEQIVKLDATELEATEEAASEVRNQGVGEPEYRALSPLLPADTEPREEIVKAHATELQATEEASSELIKQDVSEPEQMEESPVLPADSENPEELVKAHVLEVETTKKVSSEVTEQDATAPEQNEESPVPNFDSERPEQIVKLGATELEATEEASSEVINQGVGEPEYRALSPLLPADSEPREEIVKAHATELQATEEASSELIKQDVSEPEQSEESPVLPADNENPEEILKAHALEVETTDEASSEVLKQDISEPERSDESPVPSFDSEPQEEVVKARAAELNAIEEASSEIRNQYVSEPEQSEESPLLHAESKHTEEMTVHALELETAKEASSEVIKQDAVEPERNEGSFMPPFDSERPEEIVKAHATELESTEEASSELRNQYASEREHNTLSPVLPADRELPEKIMTFHALDPETTEDASSEVTEQDAIEPKRNEESPVPSFDGERPEEIMKAHTTELEATGEASSEVRNQGVGEPEHWALSPVLPANSELPEESMKQDVSEPEQIEESPVLPADSQNPEEIVKAHALEVETTGEASSEAIKQDVSEPEQSEESPVLPVDSEHPEETVKSQAAELEATEEASSVRNQGDREPEQSVESHVLPVESERPEEIVNAHAAELEVLEEASLKVRIQGVRELEWCEESAMLAVDSDSNEAEGASCVDDGIVEQLHGKVFPSIDLAVADWRAEKEAATMPQIHRKAGAYSDGDTMPRASSFEPATVASSISEAIVNAHALEFEAAEEVKEQASSVVRNQRITIEPEWNKESPVLAADSERPEDSIFKADDLVFSAPSSDHKASLELINEAVKDSDTETNQAMFAGQRVPPIEALVVSPSGSDSGPLPSSVSSGEEPSGLQDSSLAVVQAAEEDSLSVADATDTALGTEQTQLPLLSYQACITTCAVDGNPVQLVDCAPGPSIPGLLSLEPVDMKTDGQPSDEVAPKVSSQLVALPASSTPCVSSVTCQNLASYQLDNYLAVVSSAATIIHQSRAEIEKGNATDCISASDNVECTSLATSEINEETRPRVTGQEIPADGMCELKERVAIDSAGPSPLADLDWSQVPAIVTTTSDSRMKKDNDLSASLACSFEEKTAEPSAELRPVFSVDSAAANHDSLRAIYESQAVKDCEELPAEPIDQRVRDQSSPTLTETQAFAGAMALHVNAGPSLSASGGEAIDGIVTVTGDMSKADQAMPVSISADSNPSAAIETTLLAATPTPTDDSHCCSQQSFGDIATTETGVQPRLSSESTLCEATLICASALAASAEASLVAAAPVGADGQSVITRTEQPTGVPAPASPPQPDGPYTSRGTDGESQTDVGASQTQQPTADDRLHDSGTETVLPLADSCCFTSPVVDRSADLHGDASEIPHNVDALSEPAAVCESALPAKLEVSTPSNDMRVQSCDDPLAADAHISGSEELEQVADSHELTTGDTVLSISHVSSVAASPSCERPLEQVEVVRNSSTVLDIAAVETVGTAAEKSLVTQDMPEEAELDDKRKHNALVGRTDAPVAIDVHESNASSLMQEAIHSYGILPDGQTVVSEPASPMTTAVACELQQQQPVHEQEQLIVDARVNPVVDAAVGCDAPDHRPCDIHEQVKGTAIADEDTSRDFEGHATHSQGGPVGSDPSDKLTTSSELPNAMAIEEASPGDADVEMPVETRSIAEMLAEPEGTGAAVPPSSDSLQPGRHEIDGITSGTVTVDVVHHSAAAPSPVEQPDSPEPSPKQEAQPSSDVVDAFSPNDPAATCSSDGAAAGPSEATKEAAAATLARESLEQTITTGDDVHATSQQLSVLAADEGAAAPSNDEGGHERDHAQLNEEVQHTSEVVSQQQLQQLQPAAVDRTADDEHDQARLQETAPLEPSTSAAVSADDGRDEENDEVLYNEWEESECEGYIAADGTIVYTRIVKKQVHEDIRLASSTRSRHPSSPSAAPSSETPEAEVSLQFGFDPAALAGPTSLSSVSPSLSRGPGEIDYEEVRPDGSLVHRRVTVTVALGPDANGREVVGAGSQSSLEQAELQKKLPQAILDRPPGNVLSRDVANSDGESNMQEPINVVTDSEKDLRADEENLPSPDEDERPLLGEDCSTVDAAFGSSIFATASHDRTEDSILAAAAAAAGWHYAPSLYFIRQLSAVEELSETDSLDRYDVNGGESGARSRQSFTRASTLDDPRSSDDGCITPAAIATQLDASRRPGAATATAALADWASPAPAVDGCRRCGGRPPAAAAAGGGDSSSSSAMRTSPICARRCLHCYCAAAAVAARASDDETGGGGGVYELHSASDTIRAQDESGEEGEEKDEEEEPEKNKKQTKKEDEEDAGDVEEEQMHERYAIAVALPRVGSLPVPPQSSTVTERGAATANDEGDLYSCDNGELSSSLHEFEELERAAELLSAAAATCSSADAAAAGECALGTSFLSAAADAFATDD